MSPTQRSLKLLRELGFMCAITEHWNPHAHIRQDLFGIIDVLGVGINGDVVAVQTTSGANTSSRVAKVQAAAVLPRLLAAGWIVEVQGWRKLKNRWAVRRVRITETGAEEVHA